MKKKVIGMFVCLLLITTTIPVMATAHEETIPLMAHTRNVEPCTRGWGELQKLLPADGSDSEFGYVVSLRNNTAIIGAPYDDDLGTWAGAAYIFTFNGTTWTQQAKLLASDGVAFNHFGCAVSLDGDTAFIAATNNDEEIVVAYVFIRSGTTWSQQQKLHAANITQGYWFEISISVVNDTALMGIPSDSEHGSNSGSASIFTRTGTTWTVQQKLFPTDITPYDNFGCTVSLSEDIAFIGAVGDDDMGSVSGSVYVFTRSGSTWVQHQKLLAADGEAHDHFGYSLALDGHTALIGAPDDSDMGNESGSAYIFTRNGTTWTQQAKLLASDGAAYDIFGISVSLQGSTALIGAIGVEDNGIDAGAAYVFIRFGTTWSQQQKLLASDGAESDHFGHAGVLDGDTLLVGAYGDDGGSAYVFTRGNQPPHPPIISGPHYGKINTEYIFSIGPITDPDGDPVYCLWSWGDGNTSSWSGPYDSGATIQFSHISREPGNYTIKVKLKDPNGSESDWSAPFIIYIVRLRLACFLGVFESFNQTDDLFIIGGRSFIVFPSTPVINKDVTIVLSKRYLGYLGLSHILGVGGISVL